MQGEKPTLTNTPEKSHCSLLQNLLSCAFYLSFGLIIFIVPVFVQMRGIVKVPFFIGGCSFFLVSLVTVIVRLAESAARESNWDKDGLIAVSTLWCLGLFLVLLPIYFGLRGVLKTGFLISGLLLLLIDLAGATYELSKREKKGAFWYWLPGLAYWAMAIILYIVRTRLNMLPILEILLVVGFLFCLFGGFAYLLAVVPYEFPTPTVGAKWPRPGLLSRLRISKQEPEADVLSLPRPNVTVVAYRLLIILFLTSILIILFAALGWR